MITFKALELINITRIYGVDVKVTTIPLGRKCQPMATHWSTMNDEETLIPQGRLQLAPKHHCTGKSFPYKSSKVHIKVTEVDSL